MLPFPQKNLEPQKGQYMKTTVLEKGLHGSPCYFRVGYDIRGSCLGLEFDARTELLRQDSGNLRVSLHFWLADGRDHRKLYRDYIGIMEKKMETTIVFWGYIGVIFIV